MAYDPLAIAPSIFSFLGLIITIIGWWVTSRQVKQQFFLQKNDADAKLHLPVLLELLENLSILESGLIFRGMHWPAKGEHRIPRFSAKDEVGKVSFARRGNDFLLLMRLVIKNCRSIIYLVPRGKLPKTLGICREIKSYFTEQQEGQKNQSEMISDSIMLIVAENTTGNGSRNLQHNEKNVSEAVNQVKKFCKRLDNAIEEELPTLCQEEVYGDRLSYVRGLFKKQL